MDNQQIISGGIESDSEYRLKSKTNTSSTLFSYYSPLHTVPLLLPIPPILLPLTFNNLLPLYTISHYDTDLHTIIRQQQKQLIAMQIQLQVLQVKGTVSRSNIRSNVKVAKLPTFNREARQVSGFLTACRLYIRMRMRGAIVEEQVQ